MKVSPGQHPECGEKGNELRYQEPLEGRFGFWGDSAQKGCAVGTRVPHRNVAGAGGPFHMQRPKGRGEAFPLDQLDCAP